LGSFLRKKKGFHPAQTAADCPAFQVKQPLLAH